MKRKRSKSGKAAMQRFEEFARRIFAVSKEDLKKAEEVVEEFVEPTEDFTPDD
jgi:hypothetical protein